MILRIILRNFLSFDDEVQFDMFPNLKKTHLNNHIYTSLHNVPLLKQAAVYGPNGAGKSNLVKALEFIRSFALDKNFMDGIEIDSFFYLLKPDAMLSPIYLALEFECDSKFFFYEIEIARETVVSEKLSETFPSEGKVDIVYERQGNDVNFASDVSVSDDIKRATVGMLEKNQMASLLALNREFPIIPDSRCDVASSWFREKLEIIGVHSFLPTLIELLRDDEHMMAFAKDLIGRMEVGIGDLNMAESDFDNWAKTHIRIADSLPGEMEVNRNKSLSLNFNDTPILSIKLEDGIRKVYQLMFDHMGKDGFVGHLTASSQSDGTLRALTLIPALYFASQKRKTVVVDEINCCLSSSMVKGIVGYFSKLQKTNGQFIFTTHDEQLLDEREILRSDEIWFVDKREGASILYSHNDFKEHHTISPLRGYKEGRYGAIRFVNLLQDEDR